MFIRHCAAPQLKLRSQGDHQKLRCERVCRTGMKGFAFANQLPNVKWSVSYVCTNIVRTMHMAPLYTMGIENSRWHSPQFSCRSTRCQLSCCTTTSASQHKTLCRTCSGSWPAALCRGFDSRDQELHRTQSRHCSHSWPNKCRLLYLPPPRGTAAACAVQEHQSAIETKSSSQTHIDELPKPALRQDKQVDGACIEVESRTACL